MARGGTLGRLNVILGVDSAEFTSSFTKAEYTASKFAENTQRSMRNIEQQTKRAADSVAAIQSNLTSLAKVTASAFSVTQIVKYSDAWVGLQNRLRLVTNSQSELATATNDVFRISQVASQGLDTTAQVYQRFAQNADTLGISLMQAARLTETVSKAVAISGSSWASADAALVQFGQAMASGQLRGQEFNSVMEQTPALAYAIAQGLGISTGELRNWSTEGKLSAETVIKALERASGSVDEQFNTRVRTIAQAFQELQNSVTKFIGEAGTSSGASTVLAEGLSLIGNNLDAIITAGITYTGLNLARTFVAHAAAISQANVATSANAVATRTAAIAQVDFARAQLAAAQATVAQATGMARLAAVEATLIPAQNALTAATQRYAAASAAVASTGILSRGLALVGGWVGAVTIALTAGVAAWQLWGRSSEDESKKAEETVNRSTYGIIRSIDAQIAKLKERNEILSPNSQSRTAYTVDNVAELRRLGGLFNDASSGTGQFAGVDPNARQIIAAKYLSDLTTLNSKLKELEKANQEINKQGQDALRNEWLKKYGTDAQKLQMELKKASEAFGGMVPKDIENAIRQSFAEKGSRAGGGNTEKLSEGEKLIEQLRRQEALIGAVTEQEKLLAEVSVGAIKFRNEGEQSIAMQIAKNIDARNAEIEATKESQRALDDLIKQIDEREKKLDDLVGRTKENERKEGVAILDDAFTRGEISEGEFMTGIRKLHKEGTETMGSMSQFAKKAARNIQETLGDNLYDALTGKFDDIAGSFAKMLARMAAQMAAAKFLEFIFGSMAAQEGTVGNIGKMMMGTGKAVGGPVSAGGLYPVNERGPELLTSGGKTYLMAGDTSGYVTPIVPAQANNVSQRAVAPTVNTTVIFQGNGNVTAETEGSQDARGREFAQMIEDNVKYIIGRETRQGGILWNMMRGGYA